MCEADCVMDWRHSPDRIVIHRVCEAEGINEKTKTYLASAPDDIWEAAFQHRKWCQMHQASFYQQPVE